MTSLRRRFLMLLITATGIVWLCAVVWIYFGSRSELEHVLDTRLQEAAPTSLSWITLCRRAKSWPRT